MKKELYKSSLFFTRDLLFYRIWNQTEQNSSVIHDVNSWNTLHYFLWKKYKHPPKFVHPFWNKYTVESMAYLFHNPKEKVKVYNTAKIVFPNYVIFSPNNKNSSSLHFPIYNIQKKNHSYCICRPCEAQYLKILLTLYQKYK